MRYFFLFVLFLSAIFSANAQYIIEESQNYPLGGAIDLDAQLKTTATPITLPFSANQPFIDDFSRAGQNIDTTKWFLDGTNRQPLKYHHGAILNPTEGVVTFDGINAKGQSYNIIYATGKTDRLESHYIDLSNNTSADNIVLSFFAEYGGFGDIPELADTLSVMLRANDGTWRSVYRVSIDSSQSTFFTYHAIPIQNSAFFHNQLQIRFESTGNQNLHADLWHLDYVYLGMNRNIQDSTIDELAIRDIEPPLLYPYTHLPFQQYNNLVNVIQTSAVKITNLSNNDANTSLQCEISDPIGNNIFTTGNTQTTNPFVAANSGYSENILAFLNQSMPALNCSYLLDANLQANNDLIPQNNHYTELSRIDSIMAYDDGEADRGLGITKAGGFGQKFYVPSPDSLSAIWICFTPVVNYNVSTQQSVYMNHHSFKVAIWDKPHPDSILYQQDNFTVEYGDSLQTFHRYKIAPVFVQDSIWVGVLQKDFLGLGVGLDVNGYNAKPIYWENSTGGWTQTNIQGALMIRPEFRNKNFKPFTSITAHNTDTENLISIYPNPLTFSTLTADFSEDISAYTFELYDLQGALIWKKNLSFPSKKCNIDLPQLSQGCYFVKHTMTTIDGKTAIKNDKLWIQ